MAQSYYSASSPYDGRYLCLSCYQTKDIANNKSQIDWVLESKGGNANYYYVGPTTVTIAGQQVYYCEAKNWTTETFPAAKGSVSGTIYVDHKAEGNKSIDVSFSTAIYNYTVKTYSGTWYLDNIPRQATITSAPNFSDTDNPTIYYSNPAGNAVDTLQACIAIGWDILISYRNIDKLSSTYAFEFTDEEREILRNAATGNTLAVNFFVTTVIGSETYYSSLPRTLTINEADPIITANVVDTNEKTIALTGDNKKLIKYYSNAKATMTAQAQKGAEMVESGYVIGNGGYSRYGKEYTFNNVESNEFVFFAIDSRENSSTAILEPSMVNYTKLTCNISNNKPDVFGNMEIACTGNYFNGSFGAVQNTLTVQYRYRVVGGSFSNWADMTITKSGNTYSASAEFAIPNFNSQFYYTFETRAIDKLETVSSTKASVKSVPVFHWSENDFVFEVPVTFKAGTENSIGDGDQTISGNLRLKGDGNYGNYLRFGDADYCYIAELADDVMTIKASRINLVANGVYVDDYPIPILDRGIWTPSLNSSAVSSYTTQYGWYSKMGQTVTVGFFIKANCYSGYHNTNISISGLPFTPMFSAAGGGMCSGAYISAGFNFQCFVAETSGNITTRVQGCNHTTDGNLSTSSSGCKYRSGGGEITLSGTITFMSST